jgi:hypothetical protein
MFSDGQLPSPLLVACIASPEGLKDLLTVRAFSRDFSNWDLVNDGVAGVEKHLS